MATGTPIISVMEWNGNSVKTDKSSSIIRFKGADDALVNSTNPLTIPGSGRTYSFEKWLRLRIGSGDPAQQLSNIKFYTDGGNSFGSNVSLFGEVSASDTFRSACNPSTNNSPPNGGSGSRSMTTVFRLTAASALSLTSAAETFSGTSTDIGKFVVMCMQVDPGATAGGLSAETLSFSYDTSAMAVATAKSLAINLNAAIAQTFTATTGFDGLTGDALPDAFGILTGQETEILFADLLANDFLGASPDDPDVTITGVTGRVNCSASLGTTSIFVTGLTSGTGSFQYIGVYSGSTDTGSVALTITDFADTALTLPFFTLLEQDLVIEQRTGHARSTGFDTYKQIISFDSGRERFTADLSSGAALGLLVEETGTNLLANAALSGAGATNPTGWLTNVDGTRSGTASTLGNADGSQAYVQTAFSVTLGGPGGRPFLAQTLTAFSTSQTFVASMIVEYYTGQATAQILGMSGFGSVTGTLFLSASQLTQGNFPQRVSMPFMNIQSATDKTTGTVRYGLGINSSTSGTMIVSRPMLEKKGGVSSFTPDSLRNPDMPIVRVDGSFPYCTASGTFVIQARPPDLPSGTQMLMQLDDGTTSNMQQIFRNTSGDIVYKIVTSGVQQFRAAYPGPTAGQTFRLQADYSSGSCAFSLNGLTACATVTTTMPLGLATMRIGHNELGGSQWNGTIAELNAYRSQQGGMILPGGGSTGGGGGGGGTGGGGGSFQPLSYYGAGHQCTSLYNSNQMKIAGGQVADSFVARKTGTVTGLRWYSIWNTSAGGGPGGNYASYQGSTNARPGGLIRARIFQNNPNAGAGGTGANVPSVVVPGVVQSGGASFTILDAHTLEAPVIVFPEMSGSCDVVANTLYHIVWDNKHSDPPNNFCEVDQLKPASSTTQTGASGRTPHNPSIPDVHDYVRYRTTSVNTWSRYNQTPLYQLRYSDGAFQGEVYMENVLQSAVNSGAITPQDEGYVPVGGSTQVRQNFMPHENCTVTQINIVSKCSSIPGGNLIATTRQQSNGAVMDTTTIAPTLVKAAGEADWLAAAVNLRNGMVLCASRTYTVTFVNDGGGSWGIGGIRDGSIGLTKTGPAGNFSPTCSVTGRAEKTTNSGSTWKGYFCNYNADTDMVDLMWYYTRTA